MRTIKFRGRAADGKWHHGSLASFPDSGTTHILPRGTCKGGAAIEDFVEVDPATVGQFTGLKDRKGADIYEGDIIEHCAQVYDFGAVWQNVWVKYRQSDCEFVGMDIFRRTKDRRETWRPLRRCVNKCAVLGNIHDNPELL